MKKYIENKPWGRYERYCLNQKCTVKILFLQPNSELSLQYHKNRNEFWKIVKGTGKITIGKKIVNAKEGDEFFVVRKTLHTIKAGKNGVDVLEISFGNFNEKDIIRIKDKYKRIK
ncbi:MAG: phosphomannose isomerase type II C-terminal cupin domain [Candidatus Staskawiczbacteria bacterium]|nr:phosphomannose isomerase type II C-terminal cupin domain [Candidatus Staskawiczbacteria bacterium]